MPRVIVIHWKPEESRERVAALRKGGFDVEVVAPKGMPGLKETLATPPDAFVIDLTRLPAQGAAVGIELRKRLTTRHVPIVFAAGAPDKVARARGLLPDATYAEWDGIAAALRRAMAKPPAAPVVPDTMAGYAGTPLPKKLGIKPGIEVALLFAPDRFENRLEPLPDGAVIRRDARRSANLVLLFAKSRAELEQRLYSSIRALAENGGLWIVWPKKSSAVESDLNGNIVRDLGLDAGLVDYKVCAIDETWSGLLFARRKSPSR